MKRSPLFEMHVELDATFMEFGEWQHPLWYSSIIEEHLAVRNSVGLFDLTFLGEILVSGEKAVSSLLKILTNDVSEMKVGELRYSLMLNDDGKIIDECIVIRLRRNEFLITSSPLKFGRVLRWLAKNSDAEFIDLSDTFVCLSIQGPKAEFTLEKFSEVNRVLLRSFEFDYLDLGKQCLVTRINYAGEDGFQIFTDVEFGKKLWYKLLIVGREFGIMPCGLAARNNLRIEKGLPTIGQDFNEDKSPLEANLGWAVKWEHDFIGKDALLEQREKGYRKLVGIELLEKGVPRRGYEISKRGERVGVVTSGTVSPTLRRGVAIGYVEPEYSSVGTVLEIVIREKGIKGRVFKG